jgi:hypothetical protein
MSQETSYPLPSNSERLAILAVDTEVVAEVVADMRRTDTPPPEFPTEPEYTTPVSPPPDIDFNEYLRMSPSLLNNSAPPTPDPVHYRLPTPTRQSPEPIPIPLRVVTSAHYHPTPRDNPNDPRNLITGISERERERMFYSISGLRDASLMLMQQEEAQARIVNPALTEHRSPPSEPSSESSISSSQPSHYTIEVDVGDVQRDHPGEGWITFNPALHCTSILIPTSESQPETQIPARYVRYHVDQYTGEPTISGTMGIGRPVYGETLQAAPEADAQPANYRDHRYFATFEEQYMISGPVTRALEDLGDYGLLGEVMRYRGLSAERRLLSVRRKEVQALEDYAQQRRADLIMITQAHEAREREVRQRLIAANALERVTRLMTQDGEYGELAWRHRCTLRREYSGAQVFRLNGGRASPVLWTSSNVQDHDLAQQDFDEQEVCLFCCWPDHIPSYCDTPHYKCSRDSAGYCRVPRHHRHFTNNMPNTCPYGGRRQHAAGKYLTKQKTAHYLTLAEREVEFDHVTRGCDDLCKGPHSQVAHRNRALLVATIEAVHAAESPAYMPRTPTPDYVPADGEGNDKM